MPTPGRCRALFAFLQAGGAIEPGELARTFNCGIGMVAIVSADDADAVTADLEAAGETVHRIGHDRGGPARLHRARQRRTPGARARTGRPPTMADASRVAVLISGRGTNMAALIYAAAPTIAPMRSCWSPATSPTRPA